MRKLLRRVFFVSPDLVGIMREGSCAAFIATFRWSDDVDWMALDHIWAAALEESCRNFPWTWREAA